MSDFDSMYNDAAWEQYVSGLIFDEEMRLSTRQQCIYLFVEGRAEEEAYPELLAKCSIDMEEMGIIIANYNGAGNLIPCINLLWKTLSHDRPVIATIDNDEVGHMILSKLEHIDSDQKRMWILPIPSVDPPIEYPRGLRGGSFEEIFSYDHFISQAFSEDFMSKTGIAGEGDFRQSFKPSSSWFNQLKKFCRERDYCDIEKFKVELGVRLAETCKEVPLDIMRLAEKLREVRNKYPIRHISEIAWDSIDP